MVTSSQTFQNTGLRGSYVSLSALLSGPQGPCTSHPDGFCYLTPSLGFHDSMQTSALSCHDMLPQRPPSTCTMDLIANSLCKLSGNAGSWQPLYTNPGSLEMHRLWVQGRGWEGLGHRLRTLRHLPVRCWIGPCTSVTMPPIKEGGCIYLAQGPHWTAKLGRHLNGVNLLLVKKTHP